MRPFESPGRGLRTGAELFCQEFMPMVTPFCYKYCMNIKNIAMAFDLFGTSGLVFKRGGKLAIQDVLFKGFVRTKKIVKK